MRSKCMRLYGLPAALLVLVALAPTASAGTPEAACAANGLASEHARVDRDIVQTASGVEVTDYLTGGSYRVTRCDVAGRRIRAVLASPVRLPNGSVKALPSMIATGDTEIAIDRGDLRLYRGDWRAAVAAARRALLPPLHPSKLTTSVVPTSPDEAGVEAAARRMQARASGATLTIRHGSRVPPRSRRIMAHASAADPCTQGDYVYSYSGHKNASLHALNLGAIGEQYRADFVNAINEGFNTWQYTYNVCGFGAVNGVSAATSGFTQSTTTDDYGATWKNNGFDLVDAGQLSAGGCAGAIACTVRWSGTLVRDIRLSTAYPYCVGWCAGYYDIQSIVAHEAGHLYGFNHSVDNSQVMYAYANTNDASKRYLWYGDYHGLYDVTACNC